MTERFRKNIPFTPKTNPAIPAMKGVVFTLDKVGGTRTVWGPAGSRLHGEGKLVHSPRKIAWGRERVLVMRAPRGLVLLAYEAYGEIPVAAFIPMCDPYARKLGLGRKGTQRWYWVKRMAVA